MKQQHAPARRRPNTPPPGFFGAAEPAPDVTYLTGAGRRGKKVAVHEVDRTRSYPVLDLL